MVLVVLAGLFGHSLAELRSIDLGFRNENVIAFTLDYPQSWKAPQMRAAREQFMDAVAAMPGVPSEMYHMFDTWVLPRLLALGLGGGVLVQR